MAFVEQKPHPKSGKYRAGFTNWQGRQIRFTGTTNAKETKRMADALEDKHRRIRVGDMPPPKSWDQAEARDIAETVGEYLAWGNAQGGRGGRPWGQGHARMRQSILGWWLERLGLKTLGDTEGILPRVEKALRDFQTQTRTKKQNPRKPSGKTMQNYAEALRAFFVWCKGRGFLEADPLAGMAGYDTTPQTQRRCVTGAEIVALLDKCADHRRLLYETAFTSGLRKGELLALTVNHLDETHGGLRLDAAWTKSRKAAFQPLPGWLVERLAAFAKAGTAAKLYKQFADCGPRAQKPRAIPANPLLYVPTHTARDLAKDLASAGLSKWAPGGKVDFHALRVAYVSFMLEAGASAKEAQTLARHSKPELTMNIYARARSERLSELAEAVGETIRATPEAAKAVKTGTHDATANAVAGPILSDLRDLRAPQGGDTPTVSKQETGNTAHRGQSAFTPPLRHGDKTTGHAVSVKSYAELSNVALKTPKVAGSIPAASTCCKKLHLADRSRTETPQKPDSSSEDGLSVFL
jgi:integrase